MLHTTGSPGRPRRRAYAAVAVAVAGSFALAGVAGAAITPAAAADDGYVAYQDQSLAPEVRAADLVSRMTLTEKIAQFRSATSPFGTDRGNLSQAIPRLGVKAYRYWNEAMHGVVGLSGATSFSSGLGIGATWNRTLVGEMGSAISDEARAGANTGNGNGVTYWAPTINLSRDPRWGREDESYSEDPYLTGQLGAANVEGMQGDNSTYLKIVSTPKHYLANNAENYRRNGNSQLTDKDLREYYTPAFRQLISPEGADAQSLMTSYNEVDGTPSPANQFTIETLARRTFGFTGFITSDCDAILDIWQRHVWTPAALNGAAVTQAQATAWAIKAGTDLACDGGNYNYQYIGDDGLPAALSQGLITEDDMDVSLVRDFTVRMRLGEFDDPSKVPYDNASVYGQNQIGAASAEHTAVATEMSNEAPVLLRNDPTDAGSALLPLQTKNVVTLGYLADEAVLGGYSGSPNPGPISTDQALTEAGYTVTHFDGITPKYGQKPGVLGVTFSDASGTSTYNTQPPKASRDPMWNWTGWRGIQYDPHATNPTAMMPNEDWEGEFSLTGVTVPAGSTQLSVQQISDSYHTTTVDAGQDCPADTVTQSTYGDQTTCTVPYDTATSSPTSQSQVLKGGHFVVHEGSATGTVVATVPADGDSSSSTSVAYSGTTGSPVTLYFEYEPPTYTVSLDAAATEAVRDAQAVIVDIGTRQSESSEEMDRATIDLPRYQDRLVQLARQLNPNVVVWIQAVGEVNIESFRNTWTTAQTSQYWSAPADGGQWVCGVNAAMRPCSVGAIVWTNYNGQDQGQAAVRLLSGQANFSGKLTFTWYSNMNQMGGINDYQLTPNATNGTDGRTYWYTTADVSYPFGYGLSYSTFQYSKPRVAQSTIGGDGTFQVSVDVTNTSLTAGMETVELYLTSPLADGTTRPYEQLKGFQKISLAAGSTQTVTIDVKASDLKFWDTAKNAWTWDTGTWQYRIGPSSTGGDTGTFTLASAPTLGLETVMAIPSGVVLNTAAPSHVIDAGLSATLTDDSFLDLSDPTAAMVTYSSSDQKVATVNALGQVSPVGRGNAVITCAVTRNGETKTATFPVIVYDGAFTSSLGGQTVTLFQNLVDFGDTTVTPAAAAAGVQLHATSSADDATFAYSIAPMDENTAGATVTTDGKLTATQAGVVRVTVVATGSDGVATPRSAIVTVTDAAAPTEKGTLATGVAAAEDTLAGLSASDYTTSSWAAVQTAVANATATVASATATQADVDTAATALSSALAALAPRGDVGPLAGILAVADSLSAHSADYTADSWQTLEDAVTAAEPVVANAADASKTAVASAVAAVRAALAALKLAPATGPTAADAAQAADHATLQAVVSGFGAIDASKFTTQSATAFTQALANAKSVLAKSGATAEDLTSALVQLVSATAQLVPATTSNPNQVPVGLKTLTTHRPAVSGKLRVGKTLKVKSYKSAWTSGVTLSYKWYVSGKKVSSASKVKVKSSWKGKKILVKVTGKLSGYSTATRASKSKKIAK